MFVSFIKSCLFTDLCQTMVGRQYDKQMSNGNEADSELLTFENDVDITSFGRHDFLGVNNSLCLPPYHLTFV